MNQSFTPERIEQLKNCETLKKQFAYEIWCRTYGQGLTHKFAFEAAQETLRKLYPHFTSPTVIAQFASEWVNDPLVVDTYLQIENGAAQDEFLPNKQQIILHLVQMLDGVNAAVQASSNANGPRRLKRDFLNFRSLLVDVMGLKPEDLN